MDNLTEVEILIVEDNPEDAEIALRALKKNKLANNVLVVEDGEEALDFVFKKGKYSHDKRRCRPKIILLDLNLPKISGIEVLKELKRNNITKMIPVIVLTSSKEEQDMVESYEFGVNSYIVKPVDFDKFVQAVNDLGVYWLLLNQQPGY